MKLSSKLKWGLGAVVLSACLASWVAVGLVIIFHRTVPALTVAATCAALSTEALMWTAAAILGVTVVESRKRIGAFLMRPFRRA